jgi:CRP-like cAMP-binding protein
MRADPADRRNAVERELFLRSMALGRPPSRDNVQLGDNMAEVFFEAGSVIYEAGSAADDIYFIVRGTVQLSRDGLDPRQLGPRSVVGILNAIQEIPHDRTAVAFSDVEAMVLRNDDRLDMMEDDFEYTRGVILFTAANLQELTLELPNGGFQEPADPGPAPEADPLPLIERVLTLRDVAAFQAASIETLVSLAKVADEIRVAAGSDLFRAGEISGAFFVVARGMLELERHNPPGRARFGPASIAGGIPALGDVERIYTARALHDCVLLRFREADFFDVMEDHFELARSVLAYIASQRVLVGDQIEHRKLALALPTGLV